jgi:putative cardiolipin synthase
VHAGYEPYRVPLLDRGVELYETRAELHAARRSRPWLRFSRGSLHAKVFLIDRRLVYVGSFNWDPRSVGINTEMGILLNSPALAVRLSDLTDEWLREDSWRVELDSSRRLRWVRRDAGRDVVANREPDAGFWRRVFAALMALLPIRTQL